MPQHLNIITSFAYTGLSTLLTYWTVPHTAICLQNILYHRTLRTDNTLSQQLAITELLSQHIAYILNCTSAIWLQNFRYLRTLLTDITVSQQLAFTELLSQHIAYTLNCTSANWLQNFLYLRTLITDNTLSQQLAIMLNCISANGPLLQDYTEWEGDMTTSM